MQEKIFLHSLAMKQLFDSVKVTDEEVKDYYEANKSQFKKGRLFTQSISLQIRGKM